MEGVLVVLLSLVLVVLSVLILAVARLVRATRVDKVPDPAPVVPRTPAARGVGDVTGPADFDEEPTVRVLPAPWEGSGAPATTDADSPADRDGTAARTGDSAVTAGRSDGGLRAAHGGSAEEAAQIVARAEREAAERLARAERDAAEIRRRGEEDVALLRERMLAEAAVETSRVQAAARESVRAEQEAARTEIAATRAAFDGEQQAWRTELQSREVAIAAREQRVEDRMASLDDHGRRLADRDRDLLDRENDLTRRTAEVADLERARHAALEQVAGLTAGQARGELIAVIEQEARREAALTVREIEARAEEEGEERARRIVTTAIQRVASDQTTESVVTVLHLPGDEMKGRIIGREGRNIRAFESVTGVNVLIDDTPEAVLLSCFDPVRREVGRITLAALVSDGRIHPHRIEEEYARAQLEVAERCVRAGEDALLETGISEMHPELVNLLGQLRYRTSYGQNVLAHLIESAHLAGIMAAELRMPLPLAKRAALLHDLGKALTHEIEGSHALIGADVARRYGEDEQVVHAIEAHHNEVAPRSICAVLTQAADQISGGRPGARRDSLESYVKRLERIEQIAGDRPGVDKVFAMQAGREVRVMVVPEEIDDLAAHLLARDVARQIEEELTYPGQIRVTVVRETRAVGTAR
ncbi:metal dependent phosphohydrolase [Frankia casuarinae]|uniref:Ribonuclease Y n=1 Tax=Frankia casuarinae (strain DSM 45818 / CECT 9043 / HFP020203 / CcI3) TaxID=106370 RepID=RNY_FRACC|nr:MULTISPECIES: ribonuclease Y [Frankia]Q2J766.1 RecName: Full=Ribonuclease Y; Short=RNase Y [Frankia casuarinae]ABD12876.1 metal dependent phosphohydrolase [Frankia casuarinae]ETA03334.1 metal dependent phosphohydrolase [Frankia sp. CcI6]EYT92726.1 metal dependent phosphohydrolase [Frankia casuarinae]KDA43661.1 metal dependent phosphohydrolase [Frankia sp. BMG5.23]KEZ36968.1 metal dependent phosphohydrolase [Frankia sp. CeD]